jgi:hypothetical protein
MSDLRQAAQQALEALELLQNAIYNIGGEHVTGWGYANDAADSAEKPITALRAALAQQAEPVACKEQITVEELAAALGWPGGISTPLQGKVELLRIVAHARVAQQAIPVLNGMERAFSSEAMGRRDERQGLPASQQQAEPVQAVSGVVIREGLPTLLRDRDIQTTDTRLYTTPQQRKPLTDDEIEALFKGVDSEDKGRFAIVRGFARAIEAALKEKNHG